MTELKPYLLCTLALSLIAIIIRHFLKVSRDNLAESKKLKAQFKNSAANFLSVIDPIILAVKNTGSDTRYIWNTTFVSLKTAAFVFRENLNEMNRTGFDETWNKYVSVDRESLKPELKRLEPPAATVLDSTRGQQILLPILEELRKYASS